MTTPTGMWITTPDPIHRTFGFEIFLPDDPDKVEEFRKLCCQLLINDKVVSKRLLTFYQGGHFEPRWKYFEFLRTCPGCSNELQNLILDLGLKIAERLGLELDIH